MGKTMVCSRCKNDIEATDSEGNRICPICCGTEFEEAEYQIPTCTYCGCEFTEEGGFEKPPFYNAESNTFYCGCRGWD